METTNPFTERRPICDPQRFFGRREELKKVFERLANVQSVSIVGERRIGKSSLLLIIKAIGKDKDHLGQDYEFHYINLEGVESTEDFFARALEALEAKGETARDFEKALDKKALDNRKVIMCLDVFEQSSDFSEDFFKILRSLASTGHLALVTASQTKLVDLASDGLTTSPFSNIFTTVQLTELNEADCGEMLKSLAQLARKDFTPEQIRAAYKATNGNPWKLQIYGYHLYQTDGDLDQTGKLYEAELGNMSQSTAKSASLTEDMPVKPPPAAPANSTSILLLIFAAIVGLFSVQANFGPGIVVTIVLVVASLVFELVFELARARRQRGQS
jgi:uncharacterized protein